ncbi:arsenate reductase family protein [Aliiruegeria lutimaris]|uniref:Transcriptional regulator, Spx/MgsR family n=1 Tax=Aliiruegeria lutimaris TaxID=571298 RepID=A0A1G8J1Z2_9RHOB|nr:ArsC/Spx/MgsR family protein [Aliiruegeria lutimaris]SDI25073.1 transcriptional regulator, Spx/MgsR family [Aliiruegeria lutimaris]
MILYGIPTCDTCRKARKALEAAGQDVRFRDVRAEPLTAEERARFIEAFGDGLLNRRSTTWRQLSEDEREGEVDGLLAAHPTLMKRPVLSDGAQLTLGWDSKAQSAWIG